MYNQIRVNNAPQGAQQGKEMEHSYKHAITTQTYSTLLKTAGKNLQFACHGLSRESGWWNDPKTGAPIDPKTPFLVPAKLMLCVTEIAEACEGDRKDLPDDKLPHRPMLEVELADAIIRCFDLGGALGLDVGGAIAEKLAYNANRADHKPENRAQAGGKAY